MKCIIIDDDNLSRVSLTRLCEKVTGLEVIASYDSALHAIDHIKDHEDIDLFFLDIHMPELDGFDFLKTLKNPPKVIFTTSDETRALEAFEVEAVDYLLKPVTLSRLLSAVQRVTLRDQSQPIQTSESGETYEEEIFVHTDKRLVRIPVKEICVIEAKGDYILVKLDDQKMHVVRSTLKSIEGRLSPKKFIKVHRSYIVNISKIVDIEDSSILVQSEIVPISRSLRSEVIDRLNLL